MKKKQRAVMVGCGGMSGAWLRAVKDYFSDRVEVVGLVDIREEAAIGKAGEFELKEAWTGTSLEEALRATKPDVVFNCTIPEVHAATCATALRAGCHVLVEKPLAATVSEGTELRRIAAETGRTLAVIQNRRYLPGSVAVRRALAEGIIGPVHSVSVDFFLGPRFGGFREAMKHPLLLDMAIHTFDQCRQLLGRDARRVTCLEFNPPGSWYSHGASAIALFEMEGGASFSYRGSWCARGFNTAWAGSWRFIGEKGTLLWDGEDKIAAERVTGLWDGKSFIEPVERLEIPVAPLELAEREHPGNIGEFLRAVETGTVPQTAADDNLRSLAMVEGAMESARLGAAVTL
jgi:predicted dehydrogenase